MFRSSHRRFYIKKGVLRNFAKFTGKHLCQRHFLNKVADLRPATLLKKRLWHRCSPVNFAEFLGAPFLQNTWRKLLFMFRKPTEITSVLYDKVAGFYSSFYENLLYWATTNWQFWRLPEICLDRVTGKRIW